MKTGRLLLAALALGTAVALPCRAQERHEVHSLKDEARTGSKFASEPLKSAGIPFNLPYEQLTDAQKDLLKRPYEKMGPNDEPPFPEKGLMPVMQELLKLMRAVDITKIQGEMELHATVSPEGQVVAVSFVRGVDQAVDRYVAGILVRTKFKPAKCNGTPCKQDFLFRTNYFVDW